MPSTKKSHMEAAIRVVKYIKQAPGMGILMSSTVSSKLQAYCDGDWGSCLTTRKSVSGYAVKIGDSLICWKSNKQSTVSRSSAEAEYRSLTSTVAEVVWLIGLFKELGLSIQLPLDISCDSKSAIQIAANSVFHERTKHIDIDGHFIREKIQLGLINTVYLASAEQPADILTKGLLTFQHAYLMSKLGLKDIFIPPSLGGC